MRRLAVVGSPIEHSRSPAIHAAAAAALGLAWDYGRERIERGGLAGFVRALGSEWLGLSVTAPLKEEALRLADEPDDLARLAGGANTLVLGDRVRAWNTDVGGIVAAFDGAGLERAASGAILGAGATAVSALVALHRMGARQVLVALRTPAKGARLAELGASLGIDVALQPLDAELPAVDAAVSTLPATADAVPRFARAPGRMLDADYARRGGSRYAAALPDALVDGREMLLGQAVLQVRVFAHGDVDRPLPDEAAVREAMRAALLRD